MAAPAHPVLIDVPMPIRTPRLLIRPMQTGDGAATAAAVAETWDDLHLWMLWAERLKDNSAERQEIRARQVMASFLLREELNLIAVERATGEPVVWCGFHHLDWAARQGETGYWTRKSAQGKGYASEACNALIRYGFAALGLRRLSVTHAAGNDASRRVIEKLGFVPEGVLRGAMTLPGGRVADRYVYARLDAGGLDALEVSW